MKEIKPIEHETEAGALKGFYVGDREMVLPTGALFMPTDGGYTLYRKTGDSLESVGRFLPYDPTAEEIDDAVVYAWKLLRDD